jgi:hypothetical protein
LHVGETLAEIQPCSDKERVERGAKPLVLVCIVSKAMCGYDRSVAPSAHLLVIRQYLRDSDFSQNHALRVSIAETHSTFTICPKRSDGSGDLERVRAFVLRLLIVFEYLFLYSFTERIAVY